MYQRFLGRTISLPEWMLLQVLKVALKGVNTKPRLALTLQNVLTKCTKLDSVQLTHHKYSINCVFTLPMILKLKFSIWI
jgi:hypothetical protein